MEISELVHDESASYTKMFRCKHVGCTKAFCRRSDLARGCAYRGCQKRFIQRSALDDHQRTHSGERPYICNMCPKTYGTSSSLARHRRVHTGRSPYQCMAADCGKRFRRKTSLNQHKRRKHGDSLHEGRAQKLADDMNGSSQYAMPPSGSTWKERSRDVPVARRSRHAFSKGVHPHFEWHDGLRIAEGQHLTKQSNLSSSFTPSLPHPTVMLEGREGLTVESNFSSSANNTKALVIIDGRAWLNDYWYGDYFYTYREPQCHPRPFALTNAETHHYHNHSVSHMEKSDTLQDFLFQDTNLCQDFASSSHTRNPSQNSFCRLGEVHPFEHVDGKSDEMSGTSAQVSGTIACNRFF